MARQSHAISSNYPPISHLGLSLLPATSTISAIYFITMDYGRNNILFILYVQIMIDPKFICVCIRFEIIQLYIVNNKCILIKIYTFLERALFIYVVLIRMFFRMIGSKNDYFNGIYLHPLIHDVSNALLREALVVD